MLVVEHLSPVTTVEYMVGESNAITVAGVIGISGNDSTLLNIPRSMELDNQLNLYVTDGLKS